VTTRTRDDRRRSLLLDLFDRAFRGAAWHGTPLWGALRGVRVKEALWRPPHGRGRHCIWELALHAAYWKCAVRRRLLRDPAIAFPRVGSDWPQLPERKDAAAWNSDLALLKREHLLLRRAIAGLGPAELERRLGRWTALQNAYGVATHDLYHTGQIQLLKKLHRKQDR